MHTMSNGPKQFEKAMRETNFVTDEIEHLCLFHQQILLPLTGKQPQTEN